MDQNQLKRENTTRCRKVEKKEERGSKQIEEHTAMNAQPIPLFSDEQMASLSRKERKRLRRQGHTTNKKTG